MDIPIAVVGGAAIIWMSRWGAWWLPCSVAVAGLVAAVRHGEATPLVVFAVVLALASVAYRLRFHPHTNWVQRIAMALNLVGFSHIEGGPFRGASAVFALVVGVAYLVVCSRSMRRQFRRRLWWSVASLMAFLAVASVGFLISALQAKDDLVNAEGEARQAIANLKRGDFATGAEQLHAAESHFASARSQLHQPWNYLAALVPVVAQVRHDTNRLVDTGAEAVAAAADAADQIDPAALKLIDGRINIGAIAAVRQPVEQLHDSFRRLLSVLDEPMSQWVPQRVADRIAHLRKEAHSYAAPLDRLTQAINVAPAMLGADHPRRYFLAFSTPAESRSLGGYIGNYGILRIDRGRLSLERFGRTADLVDAVPSTGLHIAIDPDFRQRWGGFNVLDSKGNLTATTWKNIALTPDLPTMGGLVTQMWKATFSDTIDGVVVLDPYTLAQLIGYTNGQQLPGYATPITAANAADFILREQYLAFPSVDNTQRIDALDLLAHGTLDALLHGGLPEPVALTRDLGPFVREHRLAMWTTRKDEQAMLDAVGLSGAFPPARGTADFGITFNNAGPNKIDAYLTHSVTTSIRHNADLDVDVVDLNLHLSNNAPASGLPFYVAGNSSGAPEGTALLYLSFYGHAGVVGATLNGAPWALSVGRELGLDVGSNYLDIAPGSSVDLTVTFLAGPTPRTAGWTVYMSPTAQRGNP